MPFLPFIPFANCAEIVCEGVMAGQNTFLTFAFTKTGGYIGTDLQDLADEIAGWLVSDLAPIQNAGVTWVNVKATDLTTETSPVVNSTAGLPVNGGVSTGAVTNQVALVVSFKTALRGRSYRGRNYIMGVPTADLSTTTEYTAAAANVFASKYLDLVTTLVPPGNVHVILSRFNNGVRRTIGVATAVTEYIGKTPVATQRRRIIGHGS